MIQRIQSIFLLIAGILMGITAFSPLIGGIDAENTSLTLYSFAFKANDVLAKPTWGILTMAVISTILCVVTIFLYKNRKKQIKVIYTAILAIVMYYITAIVYFLSYIQNASADMLKGAQYGIILPVLAILFLLLAINRIKKDDKLVNSLNRIR